ncbi:MAG: helicase C-terminal domain-containing protein [Gemmatimonadales bacterium]
MTALSDEARSRLVAEIAGAGGREVWFVAEVDGEGTITAVRPVARGTADAVLALPGVATRGEMVLHNHPSGVLEPSQADLNVAAKCYEAGIGFGIVNNDASSLYVVTEIPHAAEHQRLDSVSVADMLGEGGPVAAVMGMFEDRKSQRDMTSYVADVYNDGGVSLLEAGTGVGKSFAYLVPALEWARANGECTVVSTNTINLQEQLIGKDLPVLAKALAGEEYRPTYALLKGWTNYLCLARLKVALGAQESLLEPERHRELEGLANWAESTADGSLADLTEVPSYEVWDEVAAEADLCTRLECPHFDRCFVFEARRRAAEADVMVVNHHLLSADLAVRRAQENWTEGAVLPPYRRLVIDEAHHLEDTAAQHLGAQVTSRGVMRVLNRMERNGRGLIPTLLRELVGRDDAASRASVELVSGTLLRELGAARAHAERVFSLLAERLASQNGDTLRLDAAFESDEIWEHGLGVALDNLVNVFNRLRDGVDTVADRMELQEEPDTRSQLLLELRGVVRRLQSASDGLLLTLRPQQTERVVRWMERRGSKPTGGLPFPVGLAAVPLDLAPILKETLFDRVDSVILTSATLATGGDFSFLRDRLGLDLPPGRVRDEESLVSPFDFSAQCLLGIPTDVPDPRKDEIGHDRAVAALVTRLAQITDGGMFVLFTSYAALKRAASTLKGTIGGSWTILVQGEGQRDRLLRRFREVGSAILLGTDSFWEGVDVPGRALRALVLAKLPFKVPSEPLTQARLEVLAQQGLDGFRHYLLPHAALKLKQGFGRLIRSKSDVGVVILMDSRIMTRNYGRVLMESLPPARQVSGSADTVLDAAEEFFACHGVGAAV